MDTRLTAMSERVDRIAAVLPDMRIEIAYEELRKPFEMAVVATKPIESNPGEWAAAVHVFDSIKNVRSTYRIELDDKAIDELKYRLIGKAVASDLEPISFHELVNWSLEIREPVQIPNYIDAYASTVFRKNSSDYARWLGELGTIIETAPLEYEIAYWPELVNELEKNSGIYKLEQ